MSRRRVVVTGLGVVTPLGCSLKEYWDGLLSGRSGVRRIQQMDPARFDSQIAGEVVGLNLDQFVTKKEQRRMDPFCHYGIAAAKMALADAGIGPDQPDARRIGVLLGSGIGGLKVMQEQSEVLLTKGPSRFSPFMIPQMITNILAGHVAIEFGFKGPNFNVTSACASATHSIGEALRIIQHNEADMVIAGGSEAPVCELGVGGFCAMRALSTRNDAPEKASRPFDRDRDGFVIGEGAGAVVLEELERAKRRGATIYCELSGYGATCDASHITAPDPEGAGAAEAMRIAIADAGLTPDRIDYINGHATSTELGDRAETAAVKAALGPEASRKVLFSATKSMIGHLLGAAGAVESVACALSIRDSVVHPTINLDNPDPLCDLDYVPHTARQVKIGACLNNSFGFGGHNASLCFTAFRG